MMTPIVITYDHYARSFLTKAFLAAAHAVAICTAAWLLFGIPTESLLIRRILVMAGSLIYFGRTLFTAFYLMKRKMEIKEAITVAIWLFFIHTFFASLTTRNPHPIGVGEGLGIFFYVVGSYLNTASELARKNWKEEPTNKGKLYTQGLFRYSRHINYFGDNLLFFGLALMVGNLWAFVVPLAMTFLFVFAFIPPLETYLAQKYSNEFKQYCQKTKSFVPFVY